MNKQDALKEIKTIRARLKELENILQKPEMEMLWRPMISAKYWSVGHQGDAFPGTFADDSIDCARLAYGNLFPTEEAAKKASPLFARAHKIIQAALQVDPDAGLTTDERRWTAPYDGFLKQWVADTFLSNNHVAVVYVHTKEQAERMAAILNAEGMV